MYAADVDGDGDMDVLGAAGDDDDITWWENDGAQSFTEQTIEGDFDGARSVYAADMDDDGDLDILASALNADEVAIWYNYGNPEIAVLGNDIKISHADSTPDSIDNTGFTVISDTTAPADPTLITPADASTITNTDSLTFSWSAVTDNLSGLDYYTLQVDSSNDGLSIQASTDSITTTQTSYTPTALANGVYIWTVRAHDMVGNISTGLTATFTISATATSTDTTIYLPIVIMSEESTENK